MAGVKCLQPPRPPQAPQAQAHPGPAAQAQPPRPLQPPQAQSHPGPAAQAQPPRPSQVRLGTGREVSRAHERTTRLEACLVDLMLLWPDSMQSPRLGSDVHQLTQGSHLVQSMIRENRCYVGYSLEQLCNAQKIVKQQYDALLHSMCMGRGDDPISCVDGSTVIAGLPSDPLQQLQALHEEVHSLEIAIACLMNKHKRASDVG
eukprot:gene20611-27410_t